MKGFTRPVPSRRRQYFQYFRRHCLRSLSLILGLLTMLIRPLPAISADEEGLVKIGILSKQIRLLGSEALKTIELKPDRGAVCVDERMKRPTDVGTIILSRARGEWVAHVGSRVFTSPFTLRVESGPESGGGLSVRLKNGTRHYPLPVQINCSDGNLRIYAWEDIERYAIDSARAEYGPVPEGGNEAVMALAHLIMARYYYMKRRPRHNDVDFCDLTHCQVYQGRTAGEKRLDDPWRIDHERLRGNLFFHSRCGGYTLGEGVFGPVAGKKGINGGARDWLYREGTELCTGKESGWERSISESELFRILGQTAVQSEEHGPGIRYDRRILRIGLHTAGGDVSYPVETFRLMVNRVRGWNYIRSNNFAVTESRDGGARIYQFSGKGLGHGAGFCQHGALSLSRLGYTRYEIIEHYYEDIHYRALKGGVLSPYFSYCLFDLQTGDILFSSPGSRFLDRRAPPGSLFKLIVSLYLSAERDDIFRSYTYQCTGENASDGHMPEKCWNPKGHGFVRLPDAVAHSCNLYFASLYNRISERRFRAFYRRLCECLDVDGELPVVSDKREWSKMLAGLDFRITFSVRDYIRIVRFIARGSCPEGSDLCLQGVSSGEFNVMRMSLRKTFDTGTASGVLKPFGPPSVYTGLEEREGSSRLPGMWGKTSTIIDGTNRAIAYGLFIGGDDTRGIVAILRKGNGHLAARWAEAVLSEQSAGQ